MNNPTNICNTYNQTVENKNTSIPLNYNIKKVGGRNNMALDTVSIKESSVLTYSVQIAQVRELLLTTLRNQLAQPISSGLTPEKIGVPFLHINQDPPQLAAIKKVINCLYHAEEAAKAWENTDFSSSWQMAAAIPQTVGMLNQLYKSIALLNDATPEIQSLITNNYSLLSPIFTKAYELIKNSGWLPQFSKNEVVSSAHDVLTAHENTSLEMGDSHEKMNTNPLITTFSTLSKLINSMADLQKNTHSKAEQRSAFKAIHATLEELDKIPFLNQLNAQGAGDSQALKSLMAWFSTIDDETDFTKKSMQGYIHWANKHMPSLIAYVDQLERGAYLKPGLLTRDLLKAFTNINTSLNHSSITFSEQLITVKSLNKYRKERIDVGDVNHVKTIVDLQAQERKLELFIIIMERYAGQSFTALTEQDRHQIRQIYPKIQHVIAHQNLELENQLSKTLNETGGSEDKSWSKWAMKHLGTGIAYLAGSQVNQIISEKKSMVLSLQNQVEGEKFKLIIAENARNSLGYSDKTPMEELIAQRINSMKSKLNSEPEATEVKAGELVAVQASSLKNLRGNIAYLQELHLSDTVHKTRDDLTTVLHGRLSTEEAAYFTAPPYTMDKTEPELVQQIKHLENCLFRLEESLSHFEKLEWSQGTLANFQTLQAIAVAAKELYTSVTLLSPQAKKSIAPVVQTLTAYGSALSTVTQHNGDLSALGHLKEMDNAVEESESKETEHAKQPMMAVSAYRKQIEEARTSLLSRLQESLAKPLAEQLTPQQTGVPFVHLDEDAPQVAAIKKVITGLYHAERSLKTIEHIETKTELDKVFAAHQGVAALSQLYKSLNHLINAGPEMQNLIRDNYNDLIAPLFNQATTVFNSTSWFNSFKSSEVGSFVGQGINAIIPKEGQSLNLVGLMTDFPALLNQITRKMQPDYKASAGELKISQNKIKAINSILNMVAENKFSGFTLGKEGHKAFKGLIKLCDLLAQESTKLNESTLTTYKNWVDEHYPNLLTWVDEIETRFYLHPGTLSKSIAEQVDSMNQVINTKIEGQVDQNLNKVHFSNDYAPIRAEHLGNQRAVLWAELFEIEQKKQMLHFIDVYQGKSFVDLTSEDKADLTRRLTELQQIMDAGTLEIPAQLSSILNENTLEFKFESLIQNKSMIDEFLLHQEKACKLKIDVVTEAIAQHKSSDMSEDANKLKQAREEFNRTHSPDSLAQNPLKHSSSANTVHFNLQQIQKLGLSTYIAELRQQLNKKTQTYLSVYVQDYLKKSGHDGLHLVDKNDPPLIRQIKELENNLHHLNEALVHFEQIEPGTRLLSLGKSIAQIGHHAQHLINSVQNLSPEIKEHYGPAVKRMLDFSNKIQTIDYKKAYTSDLKMVFEGDEHIESAFFVGITNILQSLGTVANDATIYLNEHYANNASESKKDRTSLTVNMGKKESSPDQSFILNVSLAKVYRDMVSQLKEFEKNTQLFGNEIKKSFPMKELIYKEYLVQLSHQEDALYLKPGTLLNPAMDAVNQFFYSTSLEFNVPIEDNLELMNEVKFISIIHDELEKELIQIKSKLERDPGNSALQLEVGIKTDKLNFLTQLSAHHAKQDPFLVKQKLLDSQFTIYLREQMKKHSEVLSPLILNQYKQALEKFYGEEKNPEDLASSLKQFEQKHFNDFWLVDKGIKKLTKLGKLALEEHKTEAQDYFNLLITSSSQEKISIEERAHRINTLHENKMFIAKVGSLNNGLNLLDKFKKFITNAVGAVAEAIKTGGNVIRIYEKKKINRVIKSIEKFSSIKKELQSMKTAEVEKSEVSLKTQVDQELKNSSDSPNSSSH